MLLESLTGEAFRFDPGTPCLELGYTGGEGYRAAYETLHEPADLARWLHAFLDGTVPPVTDADLEDAKRLRNAIWRCADAQVADQPLPTPAVDEINRQAEHAPLVVRIETAPIEAGLAVSRALGEPATVRRVLSTLARDAVDLFTGPLADRIRRCAGSNCPLIFVDTSRPGRRRWCSMERCGNRAKVTAFRDRQRHEGQRTV